MRISCSACNAVYELPADRVRPGRGVKCARCGTVWVPVEREDAAPEIRPVAPEPERAEAAPVPADAAEAQPIRIPAVVAAEPPVSGPVPGPVPGLVPGLALGAEAADPVAADPVAVVAPPRAGRVPVAAGWVLSAAVLLALGWAAVAYRAGVMQAWPPSERAYRVLHLDHRGDGLAP